MRCIKPNNKKVRAGALLPVLVLVPLPRLHWEHCGHTVGGALPMQLLMLLPIPIPTPGAGAL